MSNKNNIYYRINHHKSFDFFDTSSFAQIKSLLFCELGEIDIVTIGNNIKSIFNSIIKCNNLKDKLEILNYISEQYNKNYDEFLSFYLCQKLANKNFQMVFTFSKGNITDVATILSISLKKIIKLKNKTNLKYEEFIERIKKYKHMKLNMIFLYKNCDSNNNELMNQKYDIPNEILLLIDIFQKIKKLQFKIDNFNKEIILGILLILLNYDWLFPYIFEISFDFNYPEMNKEIQKIYLNKIINKIGNKNNNFNKKESDNMELNNLKKYSNILDLIIIYTFFIDKFPLLNNLEINIPENFKKIIEDNFNNQGISSPVPHPLEYFCSLNNLKYLKVGFNALDPFLFDKVFYLIQNNSNLKYLTIDFFPKEENEKEFNFLSNLLKLSEESTNDTYLLKRKTIKLNNNDNKDVLKNILLNELIENFEINIEKLFILLQTKKNLEKLVLILNEPNIFLDEKNDDYYLILLKFIYNILNLINKENFILKSFKMISKYFKFDSNKNKSIEEFLTGINFNEKNKNLTDFELNFQINNLKNISNLISYNFQILYLGSLDKVSLHNFISFYKNKNFIDKSELLSLSIELNENISSYEECKEELIELLKNECPKNLSEFGIFCKFNINENDLSELLANGNGNCIHKYIFKIKGENIDKNKYDKNIYDKKLYYIDKIIRNKIDNYMGLILKYKFYGDNNKIIGKKLLKFLVPNNRKIVDISFI